MMGDVYNHNDNGGGRGRRMMRSLPETNAVVIVCLVVEFLMMVS